MTGYCQRLARVVAVGGLTLLLHGSSLHGQTLSPRQPPRQPEPALAPAPTAIPGEPASLLQQPAKEAQVTFTGDRLTIRADNASLAAILRQVAALSGMNFSGLGSDERVFGVFGPATASDVLSDLLNGTAYDVVLVGSASHGAPRELILTPSRAGGQTAGRTMASAVATPSNNDDANEPDAQEVPPPPDAAQPAGMRTPQQLFQQLQQMRQAQQQQIPQQEQPPVPPAQQP